MQTQSSSNVSTPSHYKVFGTVRDQFQQPMVETVVQAFDKDIRSEQLLGKTRTNAAGYYEISYTRKEFAVTDKNAADVFIRVFDKKGQLLKESDVHFNAASELQINIDLSAQAYNGPSEFEQMVAAITPFTGELPLSSLTENSQTQDISFLVNKTGIPLDKIEDIAMAFRFNMTTKIIAEVFYGLLREGIPGGALNNIITAIGGDDFETTVSQTYNGIIHTDISILMNALQKSIDENIIPYNITQQLQAIREQLSAILKQAVANAGSGGSISSELFSLTNNSVPLSNYLTDKHDIKNLDTLISLAKFNAADWEGILKSTGITPPAGTAGASDEEKIKNYAAGLEQNVAKRFPTAAFAANLAKDTKSSVNGASSISQLLTNNPQFDLLNSRIGSFAKANAKTFTPDPATAEQLRKVQRIFRLSPDYKSTNTLLADNIHSAAQIYSMGPDNFVRKYSGSLGQEQAANIFQKAKQTYAQTLAVAMNLKSLSDASALNVFPDYKIAIQNLTVEVPNLQTLFGKGDFCQCDECNAVYGAAAYLADILHFLDERHSSITGVSVKDFLLYRRPDIGDIDLDCDNTNTEIPYIDISCELMEDYIQQPVVTLPVSYLPKFVKGTIDAGLLTEINNQFTAALFPDIAMLLTSNASISEKYSASRYDGTNVVTEDHWMIRDKLMTLKATNTTGGITVLLLHQTLLSAAEIAANPEYVNIPAYNKLKDAQRPFTLPFDLSETEGELYLQKSGVPKLDLVTAFANQHDASGPPSDSQLNSAYTYLKVNEAERTLIFKEDLVNQVNYWGTLASGTTVKVDDFEQATGLAYSDVVSLLGLVFINPSQDSVIEHDQGDISCDTDKQHITNLTPTKFDHIHRFLRLWKKTSLKMVELDAVIQSPAIGNGNVDGNLAVELQNFLQLQKTWSLNAFQLLSFYQDIDTNDNNSLYDQIFQNRTITNPVNPDFALTSVKAGTLAITPGHISVITAVTGLQPADLNLLMTATDGKLSLKNLSFFYRSSLITQALSISVTEELNLKNIINIDPFSSPETTLLFVQKFTTLTTSGFSVEEINYVLRHQDDQYHSFIPTENQVAAALSPLQNSLLKVRALTTVATDPQGILLTKWLTDPLLNWNTALLTKLMDILNTSDDAEYQQKIDNNDNFLLNLRTNYFASSFSANLGMLPAITFPDSLSAQISYDNDNKLLILIGFMSATDLTNLLGLSGDAAYQKAVNSLYTASQQTDNSASHIFFSAVAAINTLRAITWAHVADRFAYFLNMISPVYRQLQQQNTLVAQISNWFKTDKTIAASLLNAVPAFYTDYTADNFVNKINNLSSANYAAQFTDYLRLQKICFVVNKLKLSADDLLWQLAHAGDVGSLDYMNLPLTAVSGSVSTFASFETLINILKFEQHYPEIVLDNTVTPPLTLSVYDIFSDAIHAKPVAAIEADLVTLTGWDAGDLKKLVEAPNYLNIQSPADFKSAEILMTLYGCFKILNQLKIHADDALAWCKASLTNDDAAKIVETLKSGYSDTDWPDVTQPLQNNLREMKRDALVAWLLANPGTQPWKTDSDLYDYFLLDVEMNSCQLTSRIVQATNSVQLFVQRCMLLLETNVVVDSSVDSDWTQWEWMKYFRLWQANYKVFLYPENWIEPDLLPVKSSFFSDLENDLQQNEVTEQNVEDSFMTYLEKLDSVAKLEVKNMWYDDPTGTLYVFARTYGGDPKTYYFRKLVEDRRWTPWEKIDLDIKSDYIVPVVYNNRLYLFWAIFTEQSDTPQTASIPSAGQSSYSIPQPNKYWQIKMAYSEYKNGKWSPKKVSNNDDTGIITAYESSYPDKSAFLFTALDVPSIDITALLNSYLKTKDTKGLINALLNALSQNGNLVINCYYQEQYQQYQQSGSGSNLYYSFRGSFELDPCRGYPVVTYDYIRIRPVLFDWSDLQNMLDDEQYQNKPLSLQSNAILNLTPGFFNNVVPLQMGFLDRFAMIMLMLQYGLKQQPGIAETGLSATLGTLLPFFYQDPGQAYYVRPEFTDDEAFEFLYSDFEKLFIALLEQNTAELQQILSTIPKNHQFSFRYHFFNFYHPLVCYFMRQLFTGGINTLMSRDTQLKGDIAYDSSPNKFSFKDYYNPTALVYDEAPGPVTYPNGVTDPDPGYPKADVDFKQESGYALYNWELFFHAPLMIAERLDQNQQFEDAEKWYRYIFNPSDTSSYPSPDKFWVTKPFFINVDNKYFVQRIDNILKGVDSGEQDLVNDVSDWRNNPFQPHYIAEYRTVAYQKTAVMKYLDHLIAWGDYLFTQDTMESVTEATQLYMLASQILGPKPQIIPPSYELPVDNYYQLQYKLDALSNALVEIENLMPLQTVIGYTGTTPQNGLPQLQALYFCLPVNDQLLGYWDTIANRLFNIRHCLNIEGVYAPLALFAPPINPGLLVRAAAAGLDIGSILNDLNSPLPFYRFNIVMQKATELVNEIKALGASMLSALEKKDAEALALLRSGQEISVLKAVMAVKNKQVDDAQSAINNLQKQQELINIRINYYHGLISAGLNAGEITALALNIGSTAIDAAIAIGYALSGGLKLVPDFMIGAAGFGGSPTATAKTGGNSFGNSAEDAVKTLSSIATGLDKGAALASTLAGYARRSDEWKFQLSLANKELEQVNQQILGAQIRLDIAQTEVQNQQLQIDNAQAADDFMHSKFTNEELYNWMITQISTVYFQAYNLAYTTAKKAERCFRYELGLSDSSYIHFGYWNSLKKGLLSGEQLMYDLKKMDMAYYEQNQREYELTKHISLSQLDGVALLKLKTTGECWINLPEELFDMDYPGHYMRRIKSVRLTIPCVAGPYTTVSCTLTLNKNSVRSSSDSSGTYARKTSNGIPADDPRFRDAIGSVQSIATSSGQNDNGLFELNFRDERYLPFEGAGAISLWHLQLSAAMQQFDYDTIGDAIIHLRYTAREGGQALRDAATQNLQSAVNSMLVSQKDKGLIRIFSARNEFPTEWYAFLNPASASDDQVLSLNLSPDRFPFFAASGNIKINAVELVADNSNNPALTTVNNIQAVSPKNITLSESLKQAGYGNFPTASYSFSNQETGIWKVINNHSNNSPLTSDLVKDLVLIVHYSL